MNTTTTKIGTMKVDGKYKRYPDGVLCKSCPEKEITVRVSSSPALTSNSRGHEGCEATIEIREVIAGLSMARRSLTLTEDEIDQLRELLFAASKELMYRRNCGDNYQGGE